MEINRIIQKYKKALISNFFIASNVMVCGFLLIMIFFISFAWKATVPKPVQAHIVGANTIAYWPMTEDAGDIINDKGGYGTPLNINLRGVNLTLFWVPGAANNGLQIRGDLYPNEPTRLEIYPPSNKIVDVAKLQNKFRIDLWLKADNITQNKYLFSIKSVVPNVCNVCIKQEGADVVFIVSNNHSDATYHENEEIIRMANALTQNTVWGITFIWNGVTGQYNYKQRTETGSLFDGTGPLPGGAGSNINNWDNTYPVVLGSNGQWASPSFGNYFYGTFYQVAVSIDTPDMSTGNSKSTDHDGDGRIDVNFGGTDCNDQLVDEMQCNITPGVPASCKNAGDLNGECQSCNPIVSRTGWTNRPINAPCNADTNGCTVNDMCDGVVTCVPGSPPGCNDGVNCTRNDCVPVAGDPVNYSCKYDVIDTNWCCIGGAPCVSADCAWTGSVNLLNTCQWCDLSQTNIAWSNYSAPPQACYTGSAATRNVGACKDGSQTCVSGAWSVCTGQTLPATEVCDNNIDNDCDSQVNEGIAAQACYTGPATTRNVGACSDGTQACTVTGWSATCTGQTLPGATEICDAGLVDENCNGFSNEGCVCINNTTQACYTGSAATRNVGACKDGSQTCVAGAWGVCTGQTLPGAETCNNIDDDCVGGIDNGLTQSQTCGTGACQRTVDQTCTAAVWSPACVSGISSPEICTNNLDDDCDSKTDLLDEDCKLTNFPVAIINAPFNTKRGKFIFVFSGKDVSISASRSYDPKGNPITFDWTQIKEVGDPSITINNATTNKISFIAPAVSALLKVELTVTNTAGLSAKNKVTVVVSEDCR